MIKNYPMVLEAEICYEASRKTSERESLDMFGEMLAFSERFRHMRAYPEKSDHVKSLIRIANMMRKAKIHRNVENA